MPSGKYLMEDFFYAGGLPAVINELKDYLHLDNITANGKSIGENTAKAVCYERKVIFSVDQPLKAEAGIAILRGNLCEQGAVIKPSAATEGLLTHRGKAVVFSSVEDYHQRVDDPDLEIDAHSVMVLQGGGPKGYPGMPEVGNLELPRKLIEEGVTDMVRISDGRMSGTAFGTVVLHVAPESAVGGTLALVQNGDYIELDVANRKLHLDVPEEELAKRRAAWIPPAKPTERGYVSLYINHVQQADRGVDLDFLVGGSGDYVPKDNH
jgi:dihydroxy-acid dehydratase